MEQVCERKSAVRTHRNADCLLKKTSTKHSKYVVNHKLRHVDDFIFRELLGKMRVVFFFFFSFFLCGQNKTMYSFHETQFN
jgi:hypothetical protein